jgi:hypothetical protein
MIKQLLSLPHVTAPPPRLGFWLRMCGKGVRVEVLNQQKRNRGSEHPLQLPEARERHQRVEKQHSRCAWSLIASYV